MTDDGSLKAGLRVLAEPFEGYFKTLGDTVSPQFLADSLSSGRMTPATLVRFMLGSVVLTSVIDAILPGKDPLALTTIPVLSELLPLSIWLAVNAMLIAMIHKPLIWLGRQAPFRLAVMAGMFISAMFFPFLALADGVYFRLTGNAFPPQAMGLAFVWIAQSLARLYRTAPGKAGGLLVGASLVMAVSIILAFETFGASLFGPTAHTAETLTPVLRQSILDYWATKPERQGATIESLSIAPTETENTFRGQLGMVQGARKETLDVAVTLDGDNIRWTLTSRPKQSPTPGRLQRRD